MKQSLFAVFVKQYYKLNSGFFLLCFLLLFLVADFRSTAYFHYSVMESADTPMVMLVLFGIWLLYAIKCFGFGYNQLQHPANSFLYQLQGLKDSQQLSVLARLQTLLYLPALVYAIITVTVLFSKGKMAAGTVILLYQFALVLLPGILYRYKLNATYNFSPFDKVIFRYSNAGKKKFEYWLLQFLLHSKKRTLLSVKVGSLLLLQALVTYNAKSLNFESVCFLMMGVIVAHAMLPYYIRQFKEERLLFVRAMPIFISRRYLWLLLTYSLLLLPELIFLLLHVQSAIPFVMILIIFALSVTQLCLFSSLIYIPGIDVEKYTLLVLVLFFVSILLLAALPAWLFAAIAFLTGLLLFLRFYERWEG